MILNYKPTTTSLGENKEKKEQLLIHEIKKLILYKLILDKNNCDDYYDGYGDYDDGNSDDDEYSDYDDDNSDDDEYSDDDNNQIGYL